MMSAVVISRRELSWGSKCLTFFRGDTGLYCYSTSAVLSMQCMVIKCRDGNIVKNEQLHGNEQ